jgi:hypothetical protein
LRRHIARVAAHRRPCRPAARSRVIINFWGREAA